VRAHIDLGGGAGTFLISGVLTGFDILSVKVINVRPDNASRGLPRLEGALTVFKASTGEPLATLDARAVTEARTAACSAVSMRLMAPRETRVLTVFGSGPQSSAHVRALTAERDFDEVRIVRRGQDGRGALRGARAVVTATNAGSPLFAADGVEDGTHLMLVGSGSHAAAEVEPALLARASAICVDHRQSCLEESGEIVAAVRDGLIDPSSVHELGEVVLGRVPGRTAESDVTIYKSVGNGTQDAALAALLLGAGVAR
jgi:ornithine cyclodeaminase/alanine dehydrogenase-like protein (mu-crystallin family)